jgi:hypothetical protein
MTDFPSGDNANLSAFSWAHSALDLQIGGRAKLEPVALSLLMQVTAKGSPSPEGCPAAQAADGKNMTLKNKVIAVRRI